MLQTLKQQCQLNLQPNDYWSLQLDEVACYNGFVHADFMHRMKSHDLGEVK
jgi:hypothetical protein